MKDPLIPTQEEIEKRAEELYEEAKMDLLGELPPGVPINTKKLWNRCYDRAKMELLDERSR